MHLGVPRLSFESANHLGCHSRARGHDKGKKNCVVGLMTAEEPARYLLVENVCRIGPYVTLDLQASNAADTVLHVAQHLVLSFLMGVVIVISQVFIKLLYSFLRPNVTKQTFIACKPCLLFIGVEYRERFTRCV